MKKLCIWAAVLLGGLTAWLLWANTALELNEWIIESPRIPDSFDGFRIAHVSDLHNTDIWNRAAELLEQAEPDLIVLTGDLIDSRNTDVERALEFARAARELAPCCYVTGNHESRVEEWKALREGLLAAGVSVLEDEKLVLERDGRTVTVLGLQDPTFGTDQDAALGMLCADGEGFKILLSHRPERMALYARHGVDLVFSGHAHGGQVRIPFVGGLVAPHQGYFPKYDAGLFREDSTVMLVSRGVGNSIVPLRVNNRPEILVAVLKASSVE